MVIRRRRQLHITQTAGLYIVGLAGVIYETVAVHVDRPALLALFAGMLGLPSFIGRDRRNDGDDENDPPAAQHRS